MHVISGLTNHFANYIVLAASLYNKLQYDLIRKVHHHQSDITGSCSMLEARMVWLGCVHFDNSKANHPILPLKHNINQYKLDYKQNVNENQVQFH